MNLLNEEQHEKSLQEESLRKDYVRKFNMAMAPEEADRWRTNMEREIASLRNALQTQKNEISELRARIRIGRQQQEFWITSLESKINNVRKPWKTMTKPCSPLLDDESDPDAVAEERALEHCQNLHGVGCTKC